jgi:putative ABC transport system ATP-binding protein
MSDLPVVDVRQVERSFGAGANAIHVLRSIDLCVAPGELIALFGPSGSGKTTLLNLIGALDSPNAGNIQVCGTEVSQLSEAARSKIRRRNIGFIFQNNTLLNTYTAAENVDMALRLVLPGLG